jgi:putative hydrolase of the HAD superfamily
VKPIRALFWDVGGVLLSNAWDHEERAQAIERFGLDANQFEQHHQENVAGFEQGRISLDEYLTRTVFSEKNDISRNDFSHYMCSLSRAKSDVLEYARLLARSERMATINNESRELNEYRIRKFSLDGIFPLFVSSCYVGLRKPDPRIYRLALDLTQASPEECCFIDDRPENIQGAQTAGMRTVLFENLDQLKQSLDQQGVAR